MLLERRSSRGVAFVIDEAGAVEAVFERAEQVLGFLRDSAEKTQAPARDLRSGASSRAKASWCRDATG